MFPRIKFWIIYLLRDNPCFRLIIVSSDFQVLLFLQDKLLESVGKRSVAAKNSLKWLPQFATVPSSSKLLHATIFVFGNQFSEDYNDNYIFNA